MARQSRDPIRAVPVLLTRPRPQSERFAAQMADRFGDRVAPVISPLLAPRFLPVTVPQDMAALILTSETGAEAAGRLRRSGAHLPDRAYCVGDRTAQASSIAGFAPISAGGDAGALIALILSRGAGGPLLHLHGQDTRGDVAERLTKAGIETRAAVVYAQDRQPLSQPALRLIAGDQAVVAALFSPRSAALFADAARDAAAPLHIPAISPTAAQAVAPPFAARLVVAMRPDAGAMLDAIGVILRDIAAA